MKVWVPLAVDKPIPFKQAVDMSFVKKAQAKFKLRWRAASASRSGTSRRPSPRALERSPPSPRVSFDVHDKEFVALVGPSGCGKSTILNMIGALVAPSGGEIVVDGERVGRRAAARRSATSSRRTRCSRGARWSGISPSASSTAACRRPSARARVTEAIALAGLEGFEDAFPPRSPGGMRQRVALMRSLVVDPEILLMDEPFGALDTHTKLNLHAELLALWEAKQQTVVFVTHDLSEAITLADRIVVMTRRPGRIKLIYDVKLPRPRDVIRAARERRSTCASTARSGTRSARNSRSGA